jgi:hypothetical protein
MLVRVRIAIEAHQIEGEGAFGDGFYISWERTEGVLVGIQQDVLAIILVVTGRIYVSVWPLGIPLV